MNIKTIEHENCAVVQVEGYLDRTTAPRLETALQAVTDGGQRCIIVDLTGVPSMSSAGLRVLLSLAKRLHGGRRHGELLLAGASRRVVDILDLAGLSPVLRVFATSDEAVASFQQSAPS